jgi:NDP-sugar pyrophosphorylase family protein
MQAVVLAGGKGTRLKPYTTVFPKPLVPLDGIPILEVVIRQLRRSGFDDIVISTGHLGELIQAFFGTGERWGTNIRYVHEDVPLNTAGALALVTRLEETFLVMNGDILTTLDYRLLLRYHMEKRGIATLGVQRRAAKIDYGVIEIGDDSQMERYTEKPAYPLLVSMGVNVFNKRCRDYIAKGEAIGIPDLVLRMKDKGEKVFCCVSDSFWLDIGRIEDYETAQSEFQRNRGAFLADDG